MVEPFKGKTLLRLKKARGQVEGILKMVEGDKYCVDIITQILALEGSLKAVSKLILESHLNTCGEKELGSKNKKRKDKFVQEIVKIVEYSGR